jgi:hypothetical protein
MNDRDSSSKEQIAVSSLGYIEGLLEIYSILASSSSTLNMYSFAKMASTISSGITSKGLLGILPYPNERCRICFMPPTWKFVSTNVNNVFVVLTDSH